MRVFAIDPGPVESAFVRYWDGEIKEHGKHRNDVVLCLGQFGGEQLVVEMIASYGMPVGAEVFDTCVWIGRYVENWSPGAWTLMKRQEVKLHLCNSPRANDATIRQALIDRFGGKAKAIGTKKAPGPLHGVKGDIWQALALAVTWSDLAQRRAA